MKILAIGVIFILVGLAYASVFEVNGHIIRDYIVIEKGIDYEDTEASIIHSCNLSNGKCLKVKCIENRKDPERETSLVKCTRLR